MSAVDDARFAAMRFEAARRIRSAEISQSGSKRCPTCREVKPLTAFGIHSSRPDGRQPVCRACRSVNKPA